MLADAEWRTPATAKMFEGRFALGKPEADLLAWLHDNGFDVSSIDKRAIRHLASLSCNEDVEVTWTLSASGTLKSADALITEAGCL